MALLLVAPQKPDQPCRITKRPDYKTNGSRPIARDIFCFTLLFAASLAHAQPILSTLGNEAAAKKAIVDFRQARTTGRNVQFVPTPTHRHLRP